MLLSQSFEHFAGSKEWYYGATKCGMISYSPIPYKFEDPFSVLYKRLFSWNLCVLQYFILHASFFFPSISTFFFPVMQTGPTFTSTCWMMTSNFHKIRPWFTCERHNVHMCFLSSSTQALQTASTTSQFPKEPFHFLEKALPTWLEQYKIKASIKHKSSQKPHEDFVQAYVINEEVSPRTSSGKEVGGVVVPTRLHTHDFLASNNLLNMG
jgi:hypothetical protein